MKQLINYFKDNSLIFVGYNNIHFDNVIINYCISYFDNDKYDAKKITNSIKNLSKIIINEDDFVVVHSPVTGLGQQTTTC